MKRLFPIRPTLQKVRKPDWRSSGGFSIIELLVAMAVLSIIVVGIANVFISFNRLSTSQEVAAGVQQSVRIAIDFMVGDIQMAGLDPVKTTNAGIEVATATNIRVTSDRNLDGGIDNSDYERITYVYDSANNELDRILYEGTGSQSNQSVIDNVTDLTFTYLDSNDAVTGTLADIRTVKISLTVAEPAGRDGTVQRTYITRARCRNIGL